MQNYLGKLSSSPLSKLIIYTKYGGVPFLNDYLISLFEGIDTFNVIFSELLMNMETFNRFYSNKNDFFKVDSSPKETETRLLTNFFNLSKTYLSFIDYNDDNSENGINNEKFLIVNSSSGKSKVLIEDYVRHLSILKPDTAVIPFEYLPKDSGNKRIGRSYAKVLEFLKLYNLNYENQNKENYSELILPIHINHIDKIPLKDFSKHEHLINGYLIITDHYTEYNLEKIDSLKNSLDKSLLSTKPRIKYGNGHPIELMVAKEMGCEYFEISYPFMISELGLCIISNLEIQKPQSTKEGENESQNENKNLIKFTYDLKKIDLSDKAFELDNNIIRNGCKCFTCTKGYSRAYIHHLIKCNELNGKILVIMHNLYYVVEFYKLYNSIINYEERIHFLGEFLENECISKTSEDIIKEEKKNKNDILNKASKKGRMEED